MEAVQTNSPYPSREPTASVTGPQPQAASPSNQRHTIERLSREEQVRRAHADQPIRELRGLSVLDSGFNFLKKMGRAACLIGGFGCSTAAVLSMFFLNVKLLGIMFAVPAALFFYVATSLDKSAKSSDQSTFIVDPFKSLSDITQHNIHYLRENPNHVYKVLQAIEDMPVGEQQSPEMLDRLSALRDAVLVERAQLYNLDDEESLMYQGQMEDYLNIIDNILPPPEGDSHRDDQVLTNLN